MAKIDREATYLNCLTSGGPIRAAVPMTRPDDRGVLGAVWKALKPGHAAHVRLMVVDNTLHLGRLSVSEGLIRTLRKREGVEVTGKPLALRFDAGGRMVLG